MIERIEGAALRAKSRFNDHILVWSVARPGRHCDLMGVGDPETEEQHEQGFVTSTGRFVDRVEAWHIAARAGQIWRVCGSDGPTVGITSESIW